MQSSCSHSMMAAALAAVAHAVLDLSSSSNNGGSNSSSGDGSCISSTNTIRGVSCPSLALDMLGRLLPQLLLTLTITKQAA